MEYPSIRIRGITVAQFPNPPLVVAFVAALASRLLADGDLHDGARAVFYVALTVWAWDEASRGIDWFRRALGVVGLAYVVYSVARALG